LLDAIRSHALSHPFLLLLVCSAALWPMRRRAAAVLDAASTRAAAIVAWALLAAVLAIYIAVPAFVDHVEPSITSLSWLVVEGGRLYPDASGPDIYGLPYGPVLFLANGAVMTVLGPGLTTAKLAGAIGAVVAVALTISAVERRERPVASVRAILAALAFGVSAFWVRAEPLLLLCAGLAAASLTLQPLASSLALGVAVGLGVNLKVSAILYLLPAFASLWARGGVRYVGLAALVAASIAALPFLAFANISIAGYAEWIASAAAHGARWSALPTALEWSLVLAVPVWLAWRAEPAGDASAFHLPLLGAIALSLPLAIKHGTGAYHFLPFVPAIVVAMSGLRPLEIRPGAACVLTAWLLTVTGLTAVQVLSWTRTLTALPAREIAAELRDMDARNGGAAAMGYSRNYRLSFFRPVLVFGGNPYMLDGASAMDWHWSRRPFPSAAIEAMRGCRIATWIVPAGSTPFELPNAYPIAGDVFPDAFRAAFQSRYRLAERGQWFDVWVCQ
jgi:hypothetical protein